ncbi:hypothetical protein L226DRAFT_498060 [Lentinus tigrinus ALCF2SS1-7]|uniref:Ribosomal protein L10 n=1 Tax=Lentinus tigrinus ALCF2SS1-6 TaxID=1328759 RepID=A0A5C2SL97_9APHY|nr:hypothetical protein L227DRAFT_598137 [Lentinus tigrinus ALCF2SS1-6]RPD82870.1 hypothetical protein L226DRAFT_498060 [Lentinus tigrinus ALCF2SS1-7]
MLGAASRLPIPRPVLIPSRTYAASLKPPVLYPRKTVPRIYSERKTYLYNQYTRLLESTSTAPLLLFEHVDFSANRLIKLRADITAAVTKHAKTTSLTAPSPTTPPPPPVDQPTFTILRTSVFGVALREKDQFDHEMRKKLAKTITGSLAVLSFPSLDPPQLKAVLRALARAVPPRQPKTQQQIDDEKKAAEAAFVPGRRPKRQRPTPVPDLKLLGAIIEGRLLMTEGVQSVAELPTLDALRAQIVGLLSAPAAQLSMVLSEASGGKLARTLEGFKKSLEPEGQDGQAEAPPS